jgi:hypothetical protein
VSVLETITALFVDQFLIMYHDSMLSTAVAKDQQAGNESFEDKIHDITYKEVPSNSGNLGLQVSCNKFASGSNMNSGNVITDRPSSRVTQPPGGKSSIHFG